jgi:hypothetical protein
MWVVGRRPVIGGIDVVGWERVEAVALTNGGASGADVHLAMALSRIGLASLIRCGEATALLFPDGLSVANSCDLVQREPDPLADGDFTGNASRARSWFPSRASDSLPNGSKPPDCADGEGDECRSSDREH